MIEMPALTISQPFAALISDGLKPIENRRWATNYRGPLAIHAGKGTQYLTRSELASYHTGCVVATCELVHVFQLSQLTPEDKQTLSRNGFDVNDLLKLDCCEGPYCWVLSEVRPLAEPFEISGQQGLWKWRVPHHSVLAY